MMGIQRIEELAAWERPEDGLESRIELARRGDKEALGQALSMFRDYLHLVADERLGPLLKAKEDASDLVQETFVRAQRGFGQFRGVTADEWRHWLRRILVRHLENRRRRYVGTAKRRSQRETAIPGKERFEPAAGDETPSGDLERRERESALLDALGRIPARYREVVI